MGIIRLGTTHDKVLETLDAMFADFTSNQLNYQIGYRNCPNRVHRFTVAAHP